MYDKELLKGILPIIILKLLNDNRKMYGYKITQTVKELSDDKILLKEGSLYPALHKLKEAGLWKQKPKILGNVSDIIIFSPKKVKSKNKKGNQN